MIRIFRHKGLKLFFETRSKAGIQPRHAARLLIQLGSLDKAVEPEEMNVPGWHLHRLSGDMDGYWSVRVNGNWRLTFAFEGRDAVVVDYQDYH